MNKLDLGGRVAVVTGAARGIGRAVAARMLDSGAEAALWYIDGDRLERTRAELAARGKVSTAVVELSDEASVNRAADATLQAHGHIDILVNNAGITGGNGTTWELDPQVWRKVIDVNLIGPYLTSRAVVQHRERRVRRRQGRQPERLALQRVESGAHRSHEVAREGAGDERRARQRRHAGRGAHRDLRFHDPGAHRLHALEDPDGAVPGSRRSRRADLLARVRRLRVQHGGRVRHLRRPGDVLANEVSSFHSPFLCAPLCLLCVLCVKDERREHWKRGHCGLAREAALRHREHRGGTEGHRDL